MSAKMHRPKLSALSASARQNARLYSHKKIDSSLLESFANPAQGKGIGHRNLWERISVPEFTCLCPITGQPDFATIEIYYSPDRMCVESKSLKLYLGSFRNIGTFHEQATTRIHDDLVKALEPRWILVIGRFTPRGGIPFHPRVWSNSFACVQGVPRELVYRE